MAVRQSLEKHSGGSSIDLSGVSVVLNQECRLLLFDKSGSGNVYFLLLTETGELDGEHIDLYGETWSELVYLKDFGICFHDNYVYIIGGKDVRTGKSLATVRRYHTLLDIWEDLPSMFLARSDSGCVFAQGKIYVTGGLLVSGKSTKSCEAFNLKSRRWERVGMLPQSRRCHSVTADSSTVYISGGQTAGKISSSVWLSENYTWNKMDQDYPTIMATSRSRHCMELFKGTLYFVGGLCQNGKTWKSINEQQGESHDDVIKDNGSPRPGNSMEAFMPLVTTDTHDDTNFISPWDWGLPPMCYERHSAASVILGDKLYIFGGTGPDNEPVCRVESFHFNTRQWHKEFLLSNCTVKNISCVVAQCRCNRRQQHSPTVSSLWAKYKWVMW